MQPGRQYGFTPEARAELWERWKRGESISDIGRALEDAALSELIRVIHAENLEVYGAPRIHIELREEHGVRVGRKRVARLMRDLGLRVCIGAVSASQEILVSACRCSRTSWSATSRR